MLAVTFARLRTPSARRAVAAGAAVALLAALGAPATARPAPAASGPLLSLVGPATQPAAGRASSVVRVRWHDRDVRAGQASLVTGTTRPISIGRAVRLQRRGPWGGWQNVRLARTSGRGTFAMRVEHPRSGTFAYRVRVNGTAHVAPAATAPVRYTVERRPVVVTARVARATVAPGTVVDLVGALTPADGAPVVRVQRLTADGEWSTYPNVVPVSASGTWAAPLDTTAAGAVTYRALTLGTLTHAPATSSSVVLTVAVPGEPTPEPPAPEPTPEPTPDPTPEPPTPTPPPPPSPTPEPTPDPTPQPPPAPAPRFVLGAAHGGNTDPAQLEADAGVPLQIRRTYYTHDKVARAAQTAQADIAKGRIPFVSFKLPYTWAEMAAGRGDAWAADAARQLAAVDGEVWVVLHHEPENDEPQILDWTRLQQRLAPMFDLPGLRFGICLTGWHQFFSGNPEMSFEHLYPFGAPIDFIALDVYQAYGTPKNLTKWTDLNGYWTRMEAFADKVDVDWGLGEFGITDEGFASPNGPTFFDDTVAGIRAHGGTFAAYFDSELNTSGNSWWLSGAKRTAFLRTLASVAAERTG
ncbi:Ig-like domain-containing protein [Nocardioides sp.]|uniref:Ig-like domain-containing protein n=1 Tax=Nocardioides sp. TaxID=35761 RepID=UPI00286BD9C3|nr:Ig-like domain-containing protein [Nocardioides sp.]